jgi:hypothetical protein
MKRQGGTTLASTDGMRGMGSRSTGSGSGLSKLACGQGGTRRSQQRHRWAPEGVVSRAEFEVGIGDWGLAMEARSSQS